MKIWKTKPVDETLAGQLAAEMHLPPILARVLGSYGFTDLAAVERFLNPRLQNVSDPFLIPQMEAAVLRTWRAIETKENILVYGDYDVDGITGAALLAQVLERLDAGHVVPALPDRLNEGYGLSPAGLQRCLAKLKPGLIITVDCGITDVESAEYLKKNGIDLIITDHHEPGKTLPSALAAVNPKLGAVDSLKTLSGVGVAFKLCHALLKHGKMKGFPSADIDLKDYLDLVALGTVADLVPLLDENRAFVRHGLKQINNSNSLAWRALKEAASLKGKLDTYHLAFGIAPRLNAAGRLDTAEMALELFLTRDENRAKVIAQKLDEANRERQAIETQILKEAAAEIDGYFKANVDYGIVVGRTGWHIGVIGIVASRLAGKYHRPVIVIGFDEKGAGRGSGRSINEYNILDGLNKCRTVLNVFGGHAMAAGMELDEKNYAQFKQLFNQAAKAELKDKDLRPVQTINAWIELKDVSDENFEALERLAPFGQDNLRPVFAARGVKITDGPRVVGKKHLRFTVSQGNVKLDAIAFNHAGSVTSPAGSVTSPAGSVTSPAGSVTSPAGSVTSPAGSVTSPADNATVKHKIPEGSIDIAFYIRKNIFNDSESLELNILDYVKSNDPGAPKQPHQQDQCVGQKE